MTGGQAALTLLAEGGGKAGDAKRKSARRAKVAVEIPILRASAEELLLHEAMLDRISKQAKGKCLFRSPPPEAAG